NPSSLSPPSRLHRFHPLLSHLLCFRSAPPRREGLRRGQGPPRLRRDRRPDPPPLSVGSGRRRRGPADLLVGSDRIEVEKIGGLGEIPCHRLRPAPAGRGSWCWSPAIRRRMSSLSRRGARRMMMMMPEMPAAEAEEVVIRVGKRW
ncbi:Os07g0173300, partial [Oryza sativa Japonica Group]